MMNGDPTVSGGVLSVRTPNPSGGGIAFDLYDAASMEYKHSVQFPIEVRHAPYEHAVYAYGEGIVATLRDTTMTLYHVSLASR